MKAISMKSVVAISTLLLASMVGALAQDVKLPPVTRTTLSNGIKLVLMEYHRAPTLVVNVSFPGGDATDPADKAGTSSIMATLLRKGTEKHNAQQLAEEIDFLGASLGASTGEDRTSVNLDILSKDTDAGLGLLTEFLRTPTFPTEELERERTLIANSLESIRENPEGVLRLMSHAIAYSGHPYGNQLTLTTLKNISRDDIVSAYHRLIVPGRMTIVAVGDFKSKEMIQKFEAAFGNWKSEVIPLAVIPTVPKQQRQLLLVDKPDSTQTQITFVGNGFPRSSEDFFKADVASTILGGGFTSRLVDEIRVNKSLTYNIGSRFEKQQKGGSFTISTFTKLETTQKILDATNEVLAKTVSRGFTQLELDKVKGFLIGMFAQKVQTPEALAGQLSDIEANGLPKDYLSTYLSKISKVTLAETNAMAKKYFSPNDLSIVLVTSVSKVDKQLKNSRNYIVRPIAEIGK